MGFGTWATTSDWPGRAIHFFFESGEFGQNGIVALADVQANDRFVLVRKDAGAIARFPIDNFSKQCPLAGVDQLGYILKRTDAIAVYERKTHHG